MVSTFMSLILVWHVAIANWWMIKWNTSPAWKCNRSPVRHGMHQSVHNNNLQHHVKMIWNHWATFWCTFWRDAYHGSMYQRQMVDQTELHRSNAKNAFWKLNCQRKRPNCARVCRWKLNRSLFIAVDWDSKRNQTTHNCDCICSKLKMQCSSSVGIITLRIDLVFDFVCLIHFQCAIPTEYVCRRWQIRLDTHRWEQQKDKTKLQHQDYENLNLTAVVQSHYRTTTLVCTPVHRFINIIEFFACAQINENKIFDICFFSHTHTLIQSNHKLKLNLNKTISFIHHPFCTWK